MSSNLTSTEINVTEVSSLDKKRHEDNNLTKEQTDKRDLLIVNESTNFQWTKLAMNMGILLIMVLSKLVRGPGGGTESVFGLDICDTVSWVAFGGLCIAAFAMTALAAKIANKEFKEKQRVGYKFTSGDQEFSGKTITKLVLVAFFAALFSGVSGISPGTIFNSLLV